MLQNLVDDLWVLNACDHFHSAAALLALVNVDCEHTLKSLCPGLAVAAGFTRWFILNRLCWHYLLTEFAVRREDSMKS